MKSKLTHPWMVKCSGMSQSGRGTDRFGINLDFVFNDNLPPQTWTSRLWGGIRWRFLKLHQLWEWHTMTANGKINPTFMNVFQGVGRYSAWGNQHLTIWAQQRTLYTYRCIYIRGVPYIICHLELQISHVAMCALWWWNWLQLDVKSRGNGAGWTTIRLMFAAGFKQNWSGSMSKQTRWH